MKRKALAFLCLFTIVNLLAACSLFGIDSESGDAPSKNKLNYSENDFDDPAYQNEMDGAELINVVHPEEDFVGKWAAGSDYSEYLYGKVVLTINKDHTWTGSITDEKYSGTWKTNEDKITIMDSEGVIVWDLSFVKDGNLIFKNTKNPDVAIVLKSME